MRLARSRRLIEIIPRILGYVLNFGVWSTQRNARRAYQIVKAPPGKKVMPQYKKLALHNSVCNEVYFRLQDCEAEHPLSKFIGECTNFNKELEQCIKNNRKQMREKNRLDAEERRNRQYEKFF